jgi:hypothetical protein
MPTSPATDRPVDGRAARPAAMVSAPAAKPAKSTPKPAENAAGSNGQGKGKAARPADPMLAGMGGAKAQAAFLYYRNMGPRRSLQKMALAYGTDQGTAESRQRSFERWSSKYGWVEKAKAWDAGEAEKQRAKRSRASERMNDDQGDTAAALWFTMTERIQDMVRLDRLDQQAYELRLADWMGSPPETRGDLPRAPRPRVGAYAAAQLLRAGFEYERIAREAASEAAEAMVDNDASALPEIFEVHLTKEKPADPVDPFEVNEAAAQAALDSLPAPLVRLSTRRPDEPVDPSDDTEEDDDEDGRIVVGRGTAADYWDDE